MKSACRPGNSVSSRDGPVTFTVGLYLSPSSRAPPPTQRGIPSSNNDSIALILAEKVHAEEDDRRRAVVLSVLSRTNLTRRQLEVAVQLRAHLRYFSNLGTIPFREMNYWLRGRVTQTSPLVSKLLYDWAIKRDAEDALLAAKLDQAAALATTPNYKTQQKQQLIAPVLTPERVNATVTTKQILSMFKQPVAQESSSKRANLVQECVPEIPMDSQVDEDAEDAAAAVEALLCSSSQVEVYIPDSQEHCSQHSLTHHHAAAAGEDLVDSQTFDENLSEIVAQERLYFESQ